MPFVLVCIEEGINLAFEAAHPCLIYKLHLCAAVLCPGVVTRVN